MGKQHKKRPKLKAPYCPSDDGGMQYEIQTFEEHTIYDYTGLNFKEVEELSLIEYLLYFRDGIIYKLSQTESGRNYLEEAFILEQTSPDRKKLRENYGRG